MSLTPTFDTTLSRVRLAATVLTGATTALFERSKNGLLWTTVRAGAAVAVSGGAANLDDYEFDANALNYYRVTGSPGGVTFTATITPVQDAVWVKSITRPFLNQPILVVDHGTIVRPSRAGLFAVIGRTYPVAVTDTRLSRVFDLTVKTETVELADSLELVFASGDPLLIQVPATGPYATVPGGYVSIGDIARDRFGKQSARRWFTLPCTEVAAPGPGVYGLPITWDLLDDEFGSWDAVVATFPTWTDVLNYVSDPSVVIVP